MFVRCSPMASRPQVVLVAIPAAVVLIPMASYGFLMVFPCFSLGSYGILAENEFWLPFKWLWSLFQWFSYGFLWLSYSFLWSSHGIPANKLFWFFFLWLWSPFIKFSYGSRMVFLWSSYGPPARK